MATIIGVAPIGPELTIPLETAHSIHYLTVGGIWLFLGLVMQFIAGDRILTGIARELPVWFLAYLEILGSDLPPINPEAFREAYCRLISGKDRKNPETPALTADLRHTFGIQALNSLEPGYADRLKPQMSKLLKSKRKAPLSIQEYVLLSIRMGRTLSDVVGYANSLPPPVWPCMNRSCESGGRNVIESKRFKSYPARWEFRCPRCSFIYSRPDPLVEQSNGVFVFKAACPPQDFPAQRHARRALYLRLRSQQSLTKAEKSILIYTRDLLSRWDFIWFSAVRKARAKPPRVKRNWAPRDEEWLCAAKSFLPEYVSTIASTGRRPIRAFQLMRALGSHRLKKFPWNSRDRFPRTMEFVLSYVEDRMTFVRRKLSLGHNTLRDGGARPSWGAFLLHYGFDQRWLHNGDNHILKAEYCSRYGFPSGST